MEKISKNFLLFLVFVLTISTIISFIPLVDAQFTYGGSSNTNSPPTIKFSIENNSVLYNLGNYNIAFYLWVGADPNWLSGPTALHSVSYKASWQNQPHVLYQWSMNEPANLEDDDPDPTSWFFYTIDLTNVPQGSHQIEVTVTGAGIVYSFTSGAEFLTFTTNGSSTLNFSISAPPSPTSSPAPANSSSGWNIQTIENNGVGWGVFNSPQVVLDSNNMPHIAYSKLFIDYVSGYTYTRFVVYASWNGLYWSTQTIAPGYPDSLVLDSNNTPHLVYEGINYATLVGSNWVTQTIDNKVGDSFGVVALDSSNRPHVAYTDGKTVNYASWTGSSWNIQTVESLNIEHNDVFQVSLAIDKNNNPHILYGIPSSYEDKNTGENYSTEIMKLAVYKNSNWKIETIPLSPPINGYGNMVLDSKGYPHFICSQRQLPSNSSSLSNLLHVSWEGNTWKTQNVVSNVSLGIYSPITNWVNVGSLALDSHDYPKISYFADALTYASWTGNSWNIQTIDTPAVSKPGLLALDSNGNPHISYLGKYSSGGYPHFIDDTAEIKYATTTEMAVAIVSPENRTYDQDSVSLNFTVNKQTSWIGYSLDGQKNVAITGNITLRGVTNGIHNITVYAKDLFGNNGTSETIYFSVEAPFPTLLIVAPAASAIVVGTVLAIYFKKRKH